MTWEAVTQKDFQDAVRSYWLWGLSALFIVIIALPPVLIVLDVIQIGAQRQAGGNGELTTDLFVFLMRDTMTLLVPLIAIIVAYAAIAGERDSGTLKLLLSLPHSRRDVVTGKVLGRSGVVVLPILAGFVVAAFVFLLTPVTLKPESFFLFAVLTGLLGVVFVAIAVGVSAGARTSRRAMIGTVGVYVLFSLFWNQFASGLISLLEDHTGVAADVRVPLHLFLKVLNPTQAYKTLVARVITENQVGARVNLLGGSGLQGALNRQAYAQQLGDSVPIYLTDEFVFLLLLAWLVAAPFVGYLVFRDADL